MTVDARRREKKRATPKLLPRATEDYSAVSSIANGEQTS